MTKKSVLEVRDLCVNLAGRQVLHNLNLDLPEHTLLGLVGPNGAGKTTLLRTILGLLPAAEGSIHVDGCVHAKARHQLGYVPQRHEFAWDFPISIEGVVTSGLTGSLGWFGRLKREHYRSVYRALEQVRLSELRERPVAELSGGQRQRVLIARALATNPKVLLLDEPFTGLDQPTMDMLSELFLELTAGGVSILMSTHDLGGAIDVCHQLAMLKGTVLAQGTPAELRDPDLWIRTYGVKRDSALLRTVGIGYEALASEASPAEASASASGGSEDGSFAEPVALASERNGDEGEAA